jgi:hypothetical protein
MMRPARLAAALRGRSLRARAALVVVALLLGAGAVAYERHASANQAQARGEALFHGAAVMPAQLATHEELLPPVATRCSNCHEAPTVTPGRAAADPRPYANALDRASLDAARSRRGGPPSRFDATRLCTLLRTGVDPAQVMLPATMPRYQATDAQCSDLWAYLMTR